MSGARGVCNDWHEPIDVSINGTDMWIPERLYRRLPVLYAAGGALTVLLFGLELPSALSALLLFAAAGVTWGWRHKEPLLPRQHRPGRPRPGQQHAGRSVSSRRKPGAKIHKLLAQRPAPRRG